MFAFHSRRMCWLGMPFALIGIRLFVQAVASPLITSPTEFDHTSAYVVAISSSETDLAVGLIVISYSAIVIGMLANGSFVRGDTRFQRKKPLIALDTQKARLASWAVFSFGVLCQIASFLLLSRTTAVADMASTRAVFTDGAALTNPLYQNARMFGGWMQWGAFGLILFAATPPQRIVGILGALGYTFFFALAGSRTSVVLSVLTLMILQHYGVKKLSTNAWVGAFALALICISATNLHRTGNVNAIDAGANVVSRVVMDSAANEVGSIVRLCPKQIPFQNGATFLSGLGHFLPGLNIPGAKNAYRLVATVTMGKAYFRDRHGGGETFSLAAECYLNFGYAGVFLVPLGLGLLFGYLFNRHQENRNDPIVLLATVGVWTVFFGSIDAKPAPAIATMGMSMFVPIAIIATFGARHRTRAREFAVLFVASAFIYLAWRISEYEWLKYVEMAILAIVVTLSAVIIYTSKHAQIRAANRGVELGHSLPRSNRVQSIGKG